MDREEVKEFLKNWVNSYGDYIDDAEGEKRFNELFEHEWNKYETKFKKQIVKKFKDSIKKKQKRRMN